jgi:hypothetical protein
MASWMAWLGFTPEQMEVLARVLGVTDSSAKVVPEQGALTAGARGSGGPAFVLKYGIMPPSQKPANLHLKYGITLPGSPGSVRIILTDKRKADLKNQGVSPCDFVDVAPTAMMKYGIAPMINNQPPAISPKYGIILPVK